MVLPNAIFVGWNSVIPGREAGAGELFAVMNAFLSKQKEAGKIEEFEPNILALHGGNVNGFWIIKGSNEQLSELRKNEEWYRCIMQGGACLTGFSHIDTYAGETCVKLVGDWSQLVAKK